MKRLGIVAAALLLSSCATIPNTSPVQVVDPAPAVVAPGGVRVVVRPPVSDMNAVQATQGFVAANASTTGNYSIARQYLTSAASGSWRPQRVDIYEPTSFEVVEVDEDTAVVNYTVIGELDADSRLILADSGSARTFEVQLEQTQSGWRIANPLNSVLMTLSDFGRNFTGYELWFLNASYEQLAPDVVWLPAASSATPTRLTQLLLAGPAGPMASALRTAVPVDTSLAIAAVPVEERTATVTLSSAALGAVGEQRRKLLAQLTFTLSQVASSVKVLVGSQPFTDSGMSEFERSDFRAMDVASSAPVDSLFVVSEGVLQRGDGSDWRQLWQLFGTVTLAANWDGRLLAVSRGSTVRVVQASSGYSVLTGPEGVVDMEFDHKSRLWLAMSDGKVKVLEPDGRLRDVVGLLPSEPVVGIAPSPDGSRLAVIAVTSAGPLLRVYPMAGSATQLGLGEPMRIERLFNEVLDADWTSSSQLVVLARSRTELADIYLVNQAQLTPTLLGGMANAVFVTARPGEPPCAVSSSGRLYCRAGEEWRELLIANAAEYAG